MRRFVLTSALVLFIGFCIYPPWRVRNPDDNFQVFVGFAPLWTGPKDIWLRDLNPVWVRPRATLDYGRLRLQFAALAGATVLALVLTKRRR